MPLRTDAMLGMAMRFAVVVDGIDLGGWAKCDGLAVEFKAEKINEGGNYEHEIFLPGQVTYESIKLERAMTLDDSASVMRWLSSKVRDYEGGTAQISLFDAHGDKVASWSLRNVYPVKWTGPSLNATGKDVAVERLELVHEGFL